MEKEYKRLPGRWRSFANAVTLWQGKDHVLLVENSGYTEQYKRFYYRDIQAFVVQKNRHRMFGNIVLGLPAVVLAVFGAIDYPVLGFLLIAAGFFGIFALVNTLLGPTCNASLVTSVNVQPVRSLNRVRVVGKALKRILPLIEEAQGALDPAQLVVELEAAAAQRGPAAALAGPAVPLRYESGRWHRWLCGMLLLVAICGGANLIFHQPATFVLVVISVVALLFPTILAVIRQAGSSLSARLRSWTWGVFAFQFIAYIIAYIGYMAAIVKHQGSGPPDEWTVMSDYISRPSTGSMAEFALHLYFMITPVFLALLGLILIHSAGRRPPPPLPAPPPLPGATPGAPA